MPEYKPMPYDKMVEITERLHAQLRASLNAWEEATITIQSGNNTITLEARRDPKLRKIVEARRGK